MMKKQWISGLLGLVCILLCACGSSAATSSVSLSELQEAMLSADPTLPEMKTIDSSSENADALFSYLSDMEYSKIQGYFLSYCADGKQADEIAVIELKSTSDKQSMLQSLQKHVDGRIQLYSTYGPEQVAKAEGAVIFDSGPYVVLIISDQASAVRSAFETLMQAE